MNLDDRARQARSSLQGHVSADLDLRAARASMEERGRRATDERRRARFAAAGIAVIALIGGALVVSQAGRNDPDRPDVASDDLDRDREGKSDAEVIEAMPLGPTDGKESWRLPVAVSPQAGLRDGDTVRLYGRGFQPHDSLGVVHCVSEADTENAGVAACDLAGTTGGAYGGVHYVTADAKGDVVVDVVVRRYIETPGYGRVDCASAPERCLLGVGAINDYDRSGGAYIDFAGSPEFAEPTLDIDADPLSIAPGQQVEVEVTGWVPRRQIRIQQCVVGPRGFDGSERCQPLIDARADAAGNFTATLSLDALVADDQGTVDCEDRCVLDATGIGIPEATTAPLPPPIRLSFLLTGSEPPSTTTLPGGTTAPPEPDDAAPTTVMDAATSTTPEQTAPATAPGG
jgi:hypothetical protein